MLINVQPDPIIAKAVFTPSWLQPLIEGTAHGLPVPDAVNTVVQALGFDTMVYGAKSVGPDDERVFVWTTAPPRLGARV